MRRTGIAVCLVAAALLCLQAAPVVAQQDLQAQIDQIKRQLSEIDALKGRVAELEKQLEDTRKAQETAAPTVTSASKGAKLKIDGRVFAGVMKSGRQGSDPNWSTEIPDAKIRFTFSPSKRITVVNRLSTSNAKNGDFDYFYLDYAGLLSPTNTLRLGQRKIDVGQETWVDNPIENMLVSNSVSHVSGYGVGAALLGNFGSAANSPLYEIGFVNGPKGVTTRPSSGLPVNVKVGAPLSNNTFASISYFSSGRLGAADKSAIAVAEIADAPTGATNWDRKLWEADLRYNYGSKGIRSLIPTGTLPGLMLGATLGGFNDDATGVADRSGNFWFLEASHGMSSKAYVAARYSVTNLDNGAAAKLAKSPVDVNSYARTSLGIGYAISDLTQLKFEYSLNNTSGGLTDPSLNQWALGAASKF
jgi:hypothetical protein